MIKNNFVNNKIIYVSFLWLLSVQTVIASHLGKIDWDAFSVNLSDLDDCSDIRENLLESCTWIDRLYAKWGEDFSQKQQGSSSESTLENENSNDRGVNVDVLHIPLLNLDGHKKNSVESRAISYSKEKVRNAKRREAYKRKLAGNKLSKDDELLAQLYERKLISHRNWYQKRKKDKSVGNVVRADKQVVLAEEPRASYLLRKNNKNVEKRKAYEEMLAGNNLPEEKKRLAQSHEKKLVAQRNWYSRKKSALNQNVSTGSVVSPEEQVITTESRADNISKERVASQAGGTIKKARI